VSLVGSLDRVLLPLDPLCVRLDRCSMAEGKVLALLEQHNKPFNVQTVSDFLATHGVKKTACQKALDALAEQGKINCKVC